MTPIPAGQKHLNLRLIRSRPALLYPFMCGAALLLCIWTANPFADAAFNDDWSYSYVALQLAETGHLRYNGWGGSMILFQSLWGSVWINIFGFSFDLMRMVTLPFSIGFVLLIYALGRKSGLAMNPAFFGALIIGTSPLFLPMAASFMTEPYACFFSTLCIYAAIASAQAVCRASATRWLWVLAVAGIFGGSDRQTVWAAPVALIPYLFWVRRFDRRFSIQAAAAFAMCITSVAFLIYHFTQPYEPAGIVKRHLGQLILHQSASALISSASLLLSGCLVSWPVFLCFPPLWKRLNVVEIVALSTISAVLTVILVCVGADLGLVPFVGNILSPVGILGAGRDALGFRPTVLPLLLRTVLTWMLVLNVVAAGSLYKQLPGKLTDIPRAVFTIFLFSYLPFLVPGALLGLTFDRYVLPLLPVSIISILLVLRPHLRRVPLSAWACLLVLASYSVATTHDYFSALRARVSSAEALRKQGVPRTHISAGLEYDGWTQLQVAGRIDAFGHGDHPNNGNATDTFWFWSYTKDVQPDYVALYSRVSEPFPPHRLSAMCFTTWMPPFRRLVVISTAADLGK